MYSNTTGSYNAASGARALNKNTTGDYNSALGYSALYSNTTGSYNAANGSQALTNNTSGSYNIANGTESLANNTSGSYNIASGYQALNSNTIGSYNIAIGNKAGENNKGSSNVFVGNNSCSNLTNASSTLCIGGVNPLISGNFSSQRVLIDGTVVITGDLYVSGTIFEGDSAGDDGFDSVDEIASGSSNQEFKASSDEGEVMIASNSLDESGSDTGDNSFDKNNNTDGLTDDGVSDDGMSDDGASDDSGDSGFIINDNAFAKDSSSSSSQFNTSTEYAELDQFLALSREVEELGNRIDMVSLELKETQQYMREGFAMSSALAAMPTPTNYGLNFSAGAGNYDGSNALAFGFVYVKENYVINIGHAKSDTGGKTMTNVGFTYNISSWFKK